METKKVVDALAALAQPSRLAIYRALVQAGPDGLPAGAIAAALGLPPATLSFHLTQLAHAGLVQGRPQGRFVIYTADFAAMNDLIGYLTENCCGGAECGPAVAQPARIERKRHETPARARRRQ
ncbi:MAG: metalloregulator ArsR/SmtB family transcription factor [Betaproteobacteria bacterium]|nr:metalloregulator ArsR/SmtB family transcription factor [Betaproteobacteria bacterium]